MLLNSSLKLRIWCSSLGQHRIYYFFSNNVNYTVTDAVVLNMFCVTRASSVRYPGKDNHDSSDPGVNTQTWMGNFTSCFCVCVHYRWVEGQIYIILMHYKHQVPYFKWKQSHTMFWRTELGSVAISGCIWLRFTYAVWQELVIQPFHVLLIKIQDSIKKLFWRTKSNVFQTTLGNRKKEIESLKWPFKWMVMYGRNRKISSSSRFIRC